ncbi:conserved hypothetical protein [Anaeromyxobacter sp. K]|uniref:cytochrome c3 family protein n=1 Tax=Anaeromyxobacter sp. (strain K) TaxID=447217 RepID=UPI00015F92EC|nr:cytochrome c3 family protein [Anaeromyxobacter sp. K]ACG73982.1 conserved hypothetical protein [Anaeromyxobacter sp. K]
MKPSTAALLASLALAAPAAARADVFSPGPLSRPHRDLEGLQSCTKCHLAGQQLSADTCLACHTELKDRVARGQGFHGRLPAAERACEKCHHEHQGRDFALVDWGPGGRKGFDHARAGFELRGKHRRVDCARCHDPRLVADPAVAEVLRKQPERRTSLGAPQRCAACHFDEHRGQLGPDCARCHGEDAWKPAARFDHARAAYRLDGKHVRVACAKCHADVVEAAGAPGPGMTPPVRAAATARYKGVPFQACTDCHKDPHQDRLGQACASCHVTADWKQVTGLGAKRAFHEKTRYPLRGAHATVACEACHGPWPGEKARYKGIAFARCTDCHADAHVGQLARAAPAGGAAARPASTNGAAAGAAADPRACDRCHGVDRFLPARFEPEDHDRTAYRLEGAHRAVACALCHPKDARLAAKVPARVREELGRHRRPVTVSLAALDLQRPSDCRSCHRDPHGRQFEARTHAEGCTACHGLDSFRKVRFDHARDARFPLTGKHERTACGSCHAPDAAGVVRWRGVPQACAGCHADAHAGQLAAKGQGTDCARCHETAGWKAPAPLRFVHQQPFTAFTLDGKHRALACEKCHPAVQVDGAAVRRYRPLPVKCQGCHADFHQGAFRGYVP